QQQALGRLALKKPTPRTESPNDLLQPVAGETAHPEKVSPNIEDGPAVGLSDAMEADLETARDSSGDTDEFDDPAPTPPPQPLAEADEVEATPPARPGLRRAVEEDDDFDEDEIPQTKRGTKLVVAAISVLALGVGVVAALSGGEKPQKPTP